MRMHPKVVAVTVTHFWSGIYISRLKYRKYGFEYYLTQNIC